MTEQKRAVLSIELTLLFVDRLETKMLFGNIDEKLCASNWHRTFLKKLVIIDEFNFTSLYPRQELINVTITFAKSIFNNTGLIIIKQIESDVKHITFFKFPYDCFANCSATLLHKAEFVSFIWISKTNITSDSFLFDRIMYSILYTCTERLLLHVIQWNPCCQYPQLFVSFSLFCHINILCNFVTKNCTDSGVSVFESSCIL